MAARPPPAALIADYLAVYEAANGKSPPPLRYEGGWFIFSGTFRTRHRRRALLDMIDVLRARAQNKD